jgi:hypothetical protein
MRMARNKREYGIAVAVVIWAAVIGYGWGLFSHYENTPGTPQPSPVRWPLASRIHRSVLTPTLLMFLHPHCPCSRASLGELELIMAHCRDKAEVKIIFVKPLGTAMDWTKTDLWQRAMKVPGIEVMVDQNGREAGIFQASVSGQTMLYDVPGHLVFSGGITSSRGHSGDNDGRDSIESFLNEGKVMVPHTPVFGCPLLNQSYSSHKGACCLWKPIKGK